MLTMRVLTLLLTLFGHEVSALSSQTVSKELGPDLSKSASITGGDAPEFPRWSNYAPPTPGVIVNAASEEDVATAVCLIYLLFLAFANFDISNR